MKKFLTKIKKATLFTAAIAFAGSAFAATPQIVSYTQDAGELLGTTQTSFKIGYNEKIVYQTYWTLLQDGVEVLNGKQKYYQLCQEAQIDFKSSGLATAVTNGIAEVGKEITLRIDSVDYVDDNGDIVNMAMGDTMTYVLTDLPVPYMYYPNKTILPDATLGEIQSSTTTNIYFTSSILSATIEVSQDGSVLGEYTMYTKNQGTAATYVMIEKADPMEEFISEMGLQAGNVDVKVIGITYGDASAPTVVYREGVFGKVTWYYSGDAGHVLSETGMEDATFYSWWAADADGGVLTLTFDQEIADGAYGYLTYGNTDGSGGAAYVDVVLSDDRLSITADFRGVLRNVSTLAPGVIWTDESGNTTDPPSAISFEIYNLYTVSGSAVQYTAWSLDKTTSALLRSRYACVYNYIDLTLPTPVIKACEFSADGTEATLTVNNTASISDCKVQFIHVDETFDVDAVIGDSIITCAVPEGLDITDIENLAVTLIDCVYVAEDGVDHVVKTYYLIDGYVPVYTSIESILALDAGTDMILNVPDGIAVTYANSSTGYYFCEDDSAALWLYADGAKSLGLSTGALITGDVRGTYRGSHRFEIDADNCDIELGGTSVYPGESVSTVSEALDDVNLYRLLTLTASDDIVFDYDGENIVVCDALYVVFMEDTEIPEKIKSLTGFVMNIGVTMFVVPNSSYMEEDQTSIVHESLIDNDGALEIYSINGIRVSATSLSDLNNGVYIVNGKKVVVLKK